MIFQLRIGDKTHYDLEYVKALTEEIVKHGKPYDEVWLATSYALPSLDKCRESVEKMKEAAKIFADRGITPSLQVSRTLGHAAVKMDMEGIDGKNVCFKRALDGTYSNGAFCFNSEGLREYLDEAMRIYAEMNPCIVWIDDDIRLRAPGGKGKSLCFCDNCINKYNKKYSHSYSLDTLRPDFMNSEEIREEYIAYQIDSICELAHIIAKAFHDVSPKSIVGLQSGVDTPLAAKTVERILETIHSVTGYDTPFRSGGGFYDDHNPIGMLEKAIGKINFANARLPECAKMRTCEIENLPFVTYGKSNEGTCLEAALYCAYGCNMASITLMHDRESMESVGKQIHLLSVYKKYLEKVIPHNEGCVNGGVAVYQSESLGGVVGEGTHLTWDNPHLCDCTELLRMGIPLNYEKDGEVYLLSSDIIDSLPDEVIENLLKRPVITDGRTVEKLAGRGFGEKLPVTANAVAPEFNFGNINTMTDHIVNRGLSHRTWHDSIYCDRSEDYVINGSNLEGIMECHAYDFLGGEFLGYYIAIVTTAFGAKWIVRGKNLEGKCLNFDMRQQLLRMLNYIADKKLPAYLDCEGQIAVIPRVDSSGKTVSVTLLNISVEDYDNIRLVINNPASESECTLVSPCDNDEKLSLVKEGESYSVKIPTLRGWRIKTILI